jgi:Cu(I)/Ag(I) efflux system membrane fusion protein
MKTKMTINTSLSLAFVALMVACSGNKSETAENHDKAKEETPAATATTDIKQFENVDASVKSQLNGFLSDYFDFNQALIEDNQDGAKEAARKLAASVEKFDMSKLQGEQMNFYHTQAAKLEQGLKGVEQSADIEEIRIELSTVSEAMYALVKAYRPTESELYYQFCPMAKNNIGANWLSSSKEIVNPYMGQRMLKCGSTQETIQ